MSGSSDRTAWPARLGFLVLGLALLFAVVGQAAFLHWLHGRPVFGPDRDSDWAALYDRLPVDDVLQVKYRHALQQERFNYGLFGNSRIVGVSHRDLGLPQGQVFNFAVGGISFRQSVALVQLLHDAGKLPEKVVISLDNHDIRYSSNLGWPGPLTAPEYYAGFFRDSYQTQPGALLMAKVVKDTVMVLIHGLVSELSIEKLTARLAFAFGDPSTGKSTYDFFGARAQPPDTLSSGQHELERRAPIWPGTVVAIKADIARLGRIVESGVHIVIYESPISPELVPDLDQQRDVATIVLRSNVQAACRTHKIVCLEAPRLTSSSEPWPDCCHAPPSVLGRYIAGLF